MNSKDTFVIIFSFRQRLHVSLVYVYHRPGLYYFSLYLNNRENIFFVDDENDRWIENNEGATLLAIVVGEVIDVHYHPSLPLTIPPINPDQSLFFP